MSDKVRVHEVAKELGILSKEVVEKAKSMGLDIKTASSSVTMEEAEQLANYIINGAPKETSAPKIKKVIKKEEENGELVESTKKPEVKKVEEKSKKTSATVESDEEFSRDKTSDNELEDSNNKDDSKEKDSKLNLKIIEPKTRTRLKIVKKKRPQDSTQPISSSSDESAVTNLSKVSSYGKMSAAALEELAKKKHKKSSSTPTTKKETGVKMDIFGGSIANVSMDYEENEVVLLDLNESVKEFVPDDTPKQPKAKKPMGRNSGKTQGSKKPKKVSRDKRKTYKKDVKDDEVVTHVEIPEDIRVYEFAEKVKRPLADVIKVLFNLGMMATKNDFLGKDEIEILSEEFDVEVTTIDPKDAFDYESGYEDDVVEDGMEKRPPVITIMGHVDHGKTSLLDAIRNAKVAHSEAGGITQHIGAYTIEQHGEMITFIDTPGHAAFSAMRKRGADVTDIIIIVVAADDGVKPQTLEAIKHAKDSGAPTIVAINKMDKESANPDLVKGQMAEQGMSPIEWGGDTEFVELSAKTGAGLDDLLENILIQADVMELKANPDVHAKATVVESSLEKGLGAVATVIIRNGTLKVGDNVVCGSAYGRVKSLLDDKGKRINKIGPSECAVVVGLNSVPGSGETLVSVDSDKIAKEFAQKRYEYDRHKELSHSTKTTLDELGSLIAEGKLKSLKIVLKTDVHGSLEAIRSSLEVLRNDEVKIEIISSGVGGITENDVQLVSGSENCVLIGFNVRPTGSVKALAKQTGVEIKTYSVIYQLIDDVTAMLTGMMETQYKETQSGQADVKETFKIPRGVVAGCMVVDGKLERGGLVRVIREGVVIYEGELTSLKRFKDDVKEVGKGYECGVVISGYEDVQVGDVIETFKKVAQEVEL